MILEKYFFIKKTHAHYLVKLLFFKFKIKSKKLIQESYKKFSSYQNNKHIVALTLQEAFVRQTDPFVFHNICLKYFDNKLENHSHIEMLIFINSLLEQNKKDTAFNILKEYHNKFDLLDIWKLLPVAEFAHSHGFVNENIQKACYVLKKLNNARKTKLFERLLENKRIAIVGNGPSEIGKNKGAEIDAHDIVIRINNYQIKHFEKDYGSKTDIWIKCLNDDIKHEIRDENIKLIVYEPDFYKHTITEKYLNVLADSLIDIDYFDFNDHIELRKKLNIFPSTGLVAIEKICKCNIKSLDCYGFSFLQENQDGYATHYFNDRSKTEAKKRSKHHSFYNETEYLKEKLKDFQNV